MENRALGKGLSALIPDRSDLQSTDVVSFVKVDSIIANTFQPRTGFNNEKLSDLIASIKEKGVLQPILVRSRESGFEVIAGERRLRAAQALGIKDVPVIVKDVSDQDALVLALIENVQREDLNALEEAEGYKRLISEFNMTQDIVAQSVGKNRSTVGNLLRLLKLPDEIKKALYDGSLSMGHARALLSIESVIEQKKLFEKTVQKQLSVRELENLIKPELSRLARRKPAHALHKDPHLVSIEEKLQRDLGTKVRIIAKNKRGKAIIEYYSLDDLDRIIQCIK